MEFKNLVFPLSSPSQPPPPPQTKYIALPYNILLAVIALLFSHTITIKKKKKNFTRIGIKI